ncbi:PREDICTED: mitochondrial import inner membrane translocase subunit TIM14-like [Chrysochloris asiatica]|uniref:Mitochondrial import inner membrane translocase subunit TIM14 n=1 Tax=Chrysochloris asiatica TaxID=185453 RepID=A0A9B0WZ00_CHRAS|nr:PREDICTED: mitochondrial import inner membrane translocase subunit TIM14-like [Chrysochloris asiatica]
MDGYTGSIDKLKCNNDLRMPNWSHGHYVLQAMEPQVKQVFQSLPKSAFSGRCYRGGFQPKMTKQEATLTLSVSPTTNKEKIRAAHRRIMLLNHSNKGGSPYIAAKINEAKDLLEGQVKK